jgi:hypothetical protein
VREVTGGEDAADTGAEVVAGAVVDLAVSGCNGVRTWCALDGARWISVSHPSAKQRLNLHAEQCTAAASLPHTSHSMPDAVAVDDEAGPAESGSGGDGDAEGAEEETVEETAEVAAVSVSNGPAAPSFVRT